MHTRSALIENRLKPFLRALLARLGYSLYRLSAEERERLSLQQRALSGQTLADVFGADLPKLHELRERYSRVTFAAARHSVWGTKADADGSHAAIGWGGMDLRQFRANNAYVWSYSTPIAQVNRLRHFVFARAAQRKDAARLLERLTEDGAFGCEVFDYPGIGVVSRDLLDSVIEINFLQRHLGILDGSGLRVLDIGAGYGRMAHRMLTAHPRIASYTCVDAVPESTFVCGFYLKHRGLQDRAHVLPLDEIEQNLIPGNFNLALNIHSFSECTYAAIEWWLTRLTQLQVRHLMIVPNDPELFQSMEPDGSRRDYAPLLRDLGYALIACEPVFDDPAEQELINVRDNMYLFELRN